MAKLSDMSHLPDIQIRPLRSEDYPAIIELWREAGLRVRTQSRDSQAAITEQIAHDATHYFVAECAGEVVGVVLGTHDGRKGWINRLAVRADQRRRGVGRLLILACEEALAAQGINVIAALINDDNEASLSLFRSSGYECHRDIYYLHKRSPADR
jgi:ribosomal protein S18 acetylase RimI-like enzyme